MHIKCYILLKIPSFGCGSAYFLLVDEQSSFQCKFSTLRTRYPYLTVKSVDSLKTKKEKRIVSIIQVKLKHISTCR